MSLFLRIWFVALFAKLVIGAWLPFLNDEAYYWVWSHDLSLSYYDHPPMVAWLFWVGHLFENLGQAGRWPSILLGHASILIWREVFKKSMSERQLLFWLGLSLTNPITGPGSLIATPDVPLLFFWSISSLFFLRAIETNSNKDFMLLGASLGLGFCSKYHIVLFPLASLVFLLVSGSWRKVSLSKILWVVAFGFIFSLPVWIWNYRNHFDSFLFQMHHGLGSKNWEPTWTFSYVGAQLALIFPTVFYLAFIKRKTTAVDSKWLNVWTLTPLLFFFFTSFRGRVEANWPVVAFPTVLALAVVKFQPGRVLKSTIVIWSVTMVITISQIVSPWLPLGSKKLKDWEFYVYDPLVKIAESYQPFYASCYQMAAALEYKMRKPIRKLKGIGRRDYYDYRDDSKPNSDTFFIAMRRWDRFPDWVQTEYKEVQSLKINDEFTLLEMKRVVP